MFGCRSVFALAILCLVVFGQHEADDCVFKHDKSSFDLRSLRQSLTSSYRVRDFDDGPERNYTYVFNVCGNAAVPANQPGCVKSDEGVTGPAPVFQIMLDGRCWRLGQMYTLTNSPINWALIDEKDPTKGVSMTYLRGDTCHFNGNKNITREFTIRFQCSDVYGRDPDARVDEDMCHYGITFETIFGCPRECPFANRKLCSGNGMCGMDTDLGGPRCFCDEGFDGADCSYVGKAPSPSACSGFCVALVFIVIIMGGLLIAAGVIYYRVWKLQKLNLRFGQMTNSLVSQGNEDETFSLTGVVNKATKTRLHH